MSFIKIVCLITFNYFALDLDVSLDESYEEIEELFDEDREARRKTRTSFQKMEMPSEY